MKIKSIHRIVLTLSLLFFIALPQQVSAGTLDDFEKGATEETGRKERHGPHKKKKTGHANAHPTSYDDMLKLFIDVFMDAFIVGGVASFDRISPEGTYSFSEEYWGYTVDKRQAGEPLIPFFRLDASYQDVESDVIAWDTRLEAGYGPVGVQARRTHYEEEITGDDLETIQMHLLYRMSFVTRVEVDVGLGYLELNGNESASGASSTIPVKLRLLEYLGIEFHPIWSNINGNLIEDYDLSLTGGWRFLSVRAGYRWFTSGSSSLNGPHAGISFYW